MSDATLPPTLDALLAHREWVRRFARTLARDDASADDLAQDVYLAAVESPPRDASRPIGWLRRVLVRRAIDVSRETSRRTARETATASSQLRAGTDDIVAVAESHRRVVEAVMALAEPYRTTILLRFFEDLPPRDVAARMGVPVETVRSRVQRACERLRARLDEEHGGRRALWLVPLLGARRAEAAPPARAVRTGPWRWLVTAAAVTSAVGLWTSADTGEGESPGRAQSARAPSSPPRGGRSSGPRHAGSAGDEASAVEPVAESPPAAAPAPAAESAREFVVRVVDVNRAPVFGVGVRIDPADMKDEIDAVSDADGRAVFQVVGRVRTARAQPRSSDGRIWRPLVQRVRVGENERSVDYLVERGASIRGTVRREDGGAFSFAGVLALENGRTVASTYADQSGAYELPVPETGAWVVCFSGMSHEEFGTTNTPTGRMTQVMDRGYGPMDGEVANVSPGAHGVDFTIAKAVGTGTLRVLVRMPDGRPLPGVAVGAADRFGLNGAPAPPSVTDTDGRAQIGDFPNCRQAIVVCAGPGDPRPWEDLGCMPPAQEVRARPGGDEAVIDFRPARAIHGVVVTPADFAPRSAEQPIAWIYLFEGDSQLGYAASGSDGKFTLMAPATSTGPFRVKAIAGSAGGRSFQGTAEFAAAATDVRVVVAAPDPPPAPNAQAPVKVEEK